MAQHSNLGSILSTLRLAAPYMPIPLYAESLRVKRALASAILTRVPVSECLTGCIKDFTLLWNMNDFEIFGRSSVMEQPFAVTSIRHGNIFNLVNVQILKIANVIMGRTPLSLSRQTSVTREVVRETIVTVGFVTPKEQVVGKYWQILAWITFAMEVTLTGGTAYVVAQHGMHLASCLLLCITVTNSISFCLRQIAEPRFGNRAALQKDRVLTARGSAALDVHVIADSWNSSKISVLCGYSSQLHALTNIPVRCTHPTLLLWICRALALVLTAQASLLAAVAGTHDNERWSSLIWMAALLCMMGFRKVSCAIVGPENVLSEQSGILDVVQPQVFTNRRAALVFISLLPVSEKVDRWTWWNAYMPDNARRMEYLSNLEGTEAFKMSRDWKISVPDWEKFAECQPLTQANAPLQEAIAVMGSRTVSQALHRYLASVLLDATV